MTVVPDNPEPRGLFPAIRLTRLADGGYGMVLVGAGLAALLLAGTVYALAFDPPGAFRGNLMMRLRPPGGAGGLMGTDQLGRDLAARVAEGLPWSLGIALAATAISVGLGTLAGLTAAWRPGLARRLIGRMTDTVIAFPSLVIAVTVIALVGRGFWPLAITLGLATWPIAARVVYAESLGLMKRGYVVAALLMGVQGWRILAAHVLPALRPTLLVMFAFTFADMLIAESALSFLGLGVPLTEPSWGNMLSESRQYLTNAPWMSLVPSAAIVLAVFTFNLIGDGIAAVARKQARDIET